jgi:glycosyltransferase involved in cell wall biosynthesis
MLSNNNFGMEYKEQDMEKVDSYNVREVDIVVGIPSYNEADNIAFVVKQCNQGLRTHFKEYSSVIINVDNNSPDGTRSAFLNSVNTIPKIYVSTEPGIMGKGNNFYNLFKEATRLKAKAVVVVDADITSITPDWVWSLASPILSNEYHFVTPVYTRHEYDGTITNNICYPLIYGLLGKNIRQPIGGDFAFSGKLASHFLEQTWHKTTFQYGIDIFMTMNALLGQFKACQAVLGVKCHKPSAPKLGPMFVQVVGTLFETLLKSKHHWIQRTEVEELPVLGGMQSASPQQLSIDYKTIRKTALSEFQRVKNPLETILSRDLFSELSKMFQAQRICITDEMWTKIVYDFLYAFEHGNGKNKIIEALKPLYFGRVVTFIRETLDLDHIDSENMIQNQARHFFDSRNYLIQRYKN